MLPPSSAMARPPVGNSGPASPPTQNPGQQGAALAKLREAVHLIELSLPDLENGSDPYKAAVDSLKTLSKALPASQEVPGVQKTALMELAQRAQQSGVLQQLQAKMSQQGQQGDQPPPMAAQGQ